MLSETMIEKAVQLFISKLPETTLEQVAHVVRSGVELKTQLDRIETRIAAIELGMQMLAKLYAGGQPQLKALPNGRDDAGQTDSIGERIARYQSES